MAIQIIYRDIMLHNMVNWLLFRISTRMIWPGMLQPVVGDQIWPQHVPLNRALWLEPHFFSWRGTKGKVNGALQCLQLAKPFCTTMAYLIPGSRNTNLRGKQLWKLCLGLGSGWWIWKQATDQPGPKYHIMYLTHIPSYICPPLLNIHSRMLELRITSLYFEKIWLANVDTWDVMWGAWSSSFAKDMDIKPPRSLKWRSSSFKSNKMDFDGPLEDDIQWLLDLPAYHNLL